MVGLLKSVRANNLKHAKTLLITCITPINNWLHTCKKSAISNLQSNMANRSLRSYLLPSNASLFNQTCFIKTSLISWVVIIFIKNNTPDIIFCRNYSLFITSTASPVTIPQLVFLLKCETWYAIRWVHWIQQQISLKSARKGSKNV